MINRNIKVIDIINTASILENFLFYLEFWIPLLYVY